MGYARGGYCHHLVKIQAFLNEVSRMHVSEDTHKPCACYREEFRNPYQSPYK